MTQKQIHDISASEERLLFLIVEDQPPFGRMVMQMLVDHEKLYVQTGKEAIKSFKEHLPDVTLLDIDLPDLDGIEVLKELKEIDPDAYIIMLTGSSWKEDVQSSLESGASGYIVKPISREKLDGYINKYIIEKNLLITKLLEEASTLTPSERDAKRKMNNPYQTTKPVSKKEDDKPEDKSEQNEPEQLKPEDISVLFVDHYEANRLNAKKGLSEKGFSIDFARSTDEALEMVRNNAYHIVFLECDLPDRDGYYLASRIRQYDRIHNMHHIIIGLGDEEKDDIQEKKWLRAGMNNYIKKPVTVTKMEDFIHRYKDHFLEEYV